MSIALPEAIQQARQSLEDGDYQETVSTCSAIVNQYPACEAAYRLLGEALLEQGQASEAERAYGRAISHDPRQPASYLGLGRIAEDRGVLEHALAYCQVAWELAPNLPEYREPVVQIASRRFGADGHLQLTHAALAQMHMRSSRMQRAVREYKTALSALPDRVDLWIGLAESLWRLGQDANAAEISREFLKEHPDLVQALVILADIEHRQGHTDEANHLVERLRRVDPDGVTVRAMVSHNSLAAADFLLIREADIPVVEARVDVVTEERPQIRIAPAPDFGYESAEAEDHTPDMEDLKPVDPGEFGDAPGLATGIGAVAAGAAALSGSDKDPADQLDEDAIAELTAGLGDLEPMAIEEFGGEASDVPDSGTLDSLSFALGEIDDTDAEPMPPAGADEMVALFGEFEEASAGEDADIPDSDNLDDLVAQLEHRDDPEGDRAGSGDPHDMADLIAQFDDIEPMGLEEFGAEPGEELTVDAITDEPPAFGDDDDAILGLAASLEDSVAGALGRAGETVPDEEMDLPDPSDADAIGLAAAGLGAAAFAADRLLSDDESPADPDLVAEAGAEAGSTEPDAFVPLPPDSPESGTGYTTLLGELGEAGLDPFDPTRTAEPPPSASSEGGEVAESDEVDLAAGWDDIDNEILNAMPVSTGNTEGLLALENLDVQPFELDPDEEGGTDFLTSFSPFGDIGKAARAADPDAELAASVAEGLPAASEETDTELFRDTPPRRIDELAGAADVVAGEQRSEYADLDEIEPFSVEEFDDGSEEDVFRFGTPSWQQDSSMAMPSEEDLDAALASEPMPEPDMQVDPSVFGYDEQTPDLDASLAVTREIGQAADLETDEEFDAQLAAAELAAAERLEERQAAEQSDPGDNVLDDAGEAPTSDDYPVTAAERLVTDEALFERTREAKQELVAEGVIAGNRELTDDLVLENLQSPAPSAREPETLAEPELVEEAVAAEAAEPEIRFETGAMQNPDTLRAALQAAPDDDEMHWFLAEALRERGDTGDAMGEYRWLIRHAPARHDAVMLALNACIDEGQEVEMAHRLLADIYRRSGDRARASSHAQLAMKARRNQR